MSDTFPSPGETQVRLPRIAVVIPNWNGADLLPRCLASLRAQTHPPDDVCVVDNGSSDGSAAAAAALDPALRIVALATNTGFANACNAGLAATESDWVLVLNNDARLATDALMRLACAAADSAPTVGALQPLVLFDDDSGRINSTGIELRGDGCAHDRDFGLPLWSVSAEGTVFGATGGAALLRRTMLEQVAVGDEVFDPTFFMYFEDVDLAWRAQLAGWTTRFVPEAIAHHRFQSTSMRHGPDFVVLQCRLNRLRCLLKNASFRFQLRSGRRSLGDVRHVFRRGRGQGLRRLVRAFRDGVRGRRSVRRVAVRSRRAVEAAWVQPDSRIGVGHERAPVVQ